MIKKNNLIETLNQKKISFVEHKHEALFSVEDSKQNRGSIEGAHTKNLFLKNKKNLFYLFSCEEKSIVDLKRFSKSINAGNLSFARKEYLYKYMKIEPGSVSPYGLLNDLDNTIEFLLEYELYKSNKINFHPLVNTSTITLKTSDFIEFMVENKKKITIFSLESNKITKVIQ